jgi:hypothetical protein
MQNTFSFSFLFSPPNPRHDGWIGQSFALSYLNSEPGNSYLFRYKPYFVGDSRINRDVKLADSVGRAGGEVEHHVLSAREASYGGYVSEDVQYAIVRKRLDALFRRDFAKALRERAASILKWLPEGSRSPLSAEELRLRLLEQAGQEAQAANQHSFSDRRYDQDSLILDEMLIGYIEKIRQGVTLRDLIAERRFDVLRDAFITIPYEFADKYLIAFTPRETLASRKPVPDPIGIRLHTHELAFRPYEHDTVEVEKIVGDKIIPGVIVYPPTLFGNEPDNIGIIQEATLGNRINVYDTVLPEVLFGSPEDKYGIGITSLRFGDIPVDTAIHLKDRSFDRHFNKETVIDRITVDIVKDISKEVRVDTEVSKADIRKSGDARIDWLMVTPYGSGVHEARLDESNEKRGDYFGSDAYVEWVKSFFDGPDIHAQPAWIVQRVVRGEPESYNAGITQDRVMLDGKDTINHSRYDYDHVRVEVIPMEARPEWSNIVRADFLEEDAQTKLYPFEMIRAELLLLNARTHDPNFIIQGSLSSKNVRFDFIDHRMTLLPHDATEFTDLSVRVEKVQTVAWIIDAIRRLDKLSKAMLIVENRHLLDKLPDQSLKVIRDIWAHYQDKSMDAIILNGDISRKAEKESLVRSVMAQQLFAVGVDLDAILMNMIQAERLDIEGIIHEHPQFGDHHNALSEAQVFDPAILAHQKDALDEAIKQRQKVADREELYGIIQKLINASNEMKLDRPGYIPKETYMLVGDLSEWEDIWNRYSPGVDVLDVPDSDYDYSRLANQVYDPETGVPFHPIGPTNQPDVKVKIPLHHPVPNFAEIGIGEAVVDNYILMDVILAVESLKNRNKLRFAGMPAEKTMRELLSKLYAWIQQAAPGVFEYERTFRFVRWYAEAVVTKLSEHILQRVYNPWISKIHENGDLGIPYTSTGWRYIPNASILQTSDTSASLSFTKENYIDGRVTIRGYFDNPRGEGKMEVKVDGDVMASLETSDNGVFTLTFDVPQGHHNYDIVFNGASGRISLSSMEITGCVFVSATTIADDSNTNGLKACTTLMQMLLYYFDKHHGDKKIKGTMAIKQRKVWQQT